MIATHLTLEATGYFYRFDEYTAIAHHTTNQADIVDSR